MGLKVAIAGASGFVGNHLIDNIKENFEVLGLSRFLRQSKDSQVTWREVDLFSLNSTRNGLREADVAIYLVHSMLPSTRLFQGNFKDTDLLLADNFARSCIENNVKQIIYLGGLIPNGQLSEHLQSRKEVENVLKATGIPTTILRAGMVVGKGGSSFEILRSLVNNLPFMVLPNWTQNKTQVIYIDDLINIISKCIGNQEHYDKTIDVINGENLTYEQLIRTLADKGKLKRAMLSVPINSVKFSKLWVTIFGQSTFELVSPLVDSLLCHFDSHTQSPFIRENIEYRTFAKMIEKINSTTVREKRSRIKRKLKESNSVRSIQRLPKIKDIDCKFIAKEYIEWLPIYMKTLIHVKTNEQHDEIMFHLSFMPNTPLLILKYIPGKYDQDRQKFHIIGGLLSKTTHTGWLEFRQVLNKEYTIAAIHEFIPSLPWYIYIVTQAPMHKIVMDAFTKHLKEESPILRTKTS
ncbi:NAD-dependent epimerase/dehydratase family protein [Halobacteriovorax sp. GB3]|uniref:NAD-dependent epimerase/dehydratase family protein n=1 Tax=Halobacteriovorax sp. GB3 TaxID=2719615 RepID=UPI00235E6D55|nr:NAD-dependent epimerase/dehydratase family protein [Halobacteriovorax sp. GB3]MDD0851801.1 NAD-dependent epimerase/dehydratase family protein [Halobacteriovorax sp. GB3]